MIRTIVAAAAACLASHAFAQDATEATIERLFAAMQVERTMQTTQAMMGASIGQATAQMLAAIEKSMADAKAAR